MTKTKPCYACENGTVRPTNLRGRPFAYRDEIGLVIDRDLVVPACDSCGELALTSELTKRLSAVLESLRTEHKRKAAQRFVETVEREFPNVPRALWEDAFGLSHGYLSRLASGARMADTALEILLEGFAKDPKTALRLVNAAGHMPSELMALLPADRRRLTPT